MTVGQLRARREKAPVERTKYRGFNVLVTENAILVSTPDGRPVGDARSMSTARRLVSGYIRESRVPS